jgi:hypothetical protein
MGHGYFLEDGGEKRTVLDENFGLGRKTRTLIKAGRVEHDHVLVPYD